MQIQFAHQTFKWDNEAKGKAAVHCVIVGYAESNNNVKTLFTYPTIVSEPIAEAVKNINPYLVSGKDIIVASRTKSIITSPKMSKGSQPTDDGNLLFNTKEELAAFLQEEPNAKNYIRKYVGAREFINNLDRWCLWLVDINPTELRGMKAILERINKVKLFRAASTSKATREFKYHHLFQQIHQPSSDYLIVPSVSSERRPYIPIGFFSKEVITSNLCLIIPDATHYHFGILSSIMHMVWINHTCGRLKSDYRYSKDIVYNNYPWPETPTDKQKQSVEEAAHAVLDARSKFPDSSLADLYDPNTMPPALVKAHQQLDKAVDQCYRSQSFTTEAKRIEYLFELYEKYTTGIFHIEKPKNNKKKYQ
jgi:hypothetical protein